MNPRPAPASGRAAAPAHPPAAARGPWALVEPAFDAARLHLHETLFTIGNGYLGTRGAFEEGYPGEARATFVHGVFDDAPIVATELANAPDWLALGVYLDGERFALDRGTLLDYRRTLDLRHARLTRRVRWQSPAGQRAQLTFERFASLANPHLLYLRCRVVPEFAGTVTFRLALNGHVDNEGLLHWRTVGQGAEGEVVYLHSQTRASAIDLASALRAGVAQGHLLERAWWDAANVPTVVLTCAAAPGEAIVIDKCVAVFTARDLPAETAADGAGHVVARRASALARSAPGWPEALAAQQAAWEPEWARCDVEIEGDDEAQLAVRFSLYHLLIAAPRTDDRVNIGAKTLSGFGYHGHAFWDTEIFMLPVFSFTSPEIARHLLNYRYECLPAARRKAAAGGYRGAQFAWESADSGDEVTPAFVPHFSERGTLVRIWTGEIELHISADIAYAAHQYWQITGDDAWFATRGVELLAATADFWAARATWNGQAGRYEYCDVIGPDEYHDHVDNNAFTNRMARWNIEAALAALDWLAARERERHAALVARLELDGARLAAWREVAAGLYQPREPSGLIEQFEGYFERRPVDLAALEPRDRSVQALFGIDETNATQVLKQPDVLMLLYLLRDEYGDEDLRVNHAYYTPRTDHTHGSSLGPAIQAIVACELGRPGEAYEHFRRAAATDLQDLRGNAAHGIHGAAAGGVWQAVVFGFAGLRAGAGGWRVQPRLPAHWRRLTFRFSHRGVPHEVDLRPE